MSAFLFCLGVFFILVGFWRSQDFTVRQWFDKEGIHFKWQDSSINFSWKQLEGMKLEWTKKDGAE